MVIVREFLSLLLVATTTASSFQREPVIVQGYDAPEGKYDFVVQVRGGAYQETQCGGTVIAENYVLTAAHCVEIMDPWGYVVGIQAPDEVKIIQDYYFSATPDRSLLQSVDKVILHPLRDASKDTSYDFALLRLTEPIVTERQIHLAMDEGFNQENQVVTALGWGRTSCTYQDSTSPVLKEDDYKLLSTQTCKDRLWNHLNGWAPISSSEICVDNLNGGQVLNGDSGGPLFVNKNDDHPVLVGVASYVFRKGCQRVGVPFVFARVSSAVDFINQHVQGHQWRKGPPIPKSNGASATLQPQSWLVIIGMLYLMYTYKG